MIRRLRAWIAVGAVGAAALVLTALPTTASFTDTVAFAGTISVAPGDEPGVDPDPQNPGGEPGEFPLSLTPEWGAFQNPLVHDVIVLKQDSPNSSSWVSDKFIMYVELPSTVTDVWIGTNGGADPVALTVNPVETGTFAKHYSDPTGLVANGSESNIWKLSTFSFQAGNVHVAPTGDVSFEFDISLMGNFQGGPYSVQLGTVRGYGTFAWQSYPSTASSGTLPDAYQEESESADVLPDAGAAVQEHDLVSPEDESAAAPTAGGEGTDDSAPDEAEPEDATQAQDATAPAPESEDTEDAGAIQPADTDPVVPAPDDRFQPDPEKSGSAPEHTECDDAACGAVDHTENDDEQHATKHDGHDGHDEEETA